MGQAFDTQAFDRLSGGAADTTFQNVTAVAGDTLQVRNGNPASPPKLERLFFNAAAGSAVRLRSPLFHDIAEGIQIFPGGFPVEGSVPHFAPQQLRPQDVLIAEQIVNAITAHGTAAMGIYYPDLPGTAARLHSWSEVAPLIKTVKWLRTTAGAGGAAGVWLDTAITVTENLLHANTDYAVLGYAVDVACTAVGVKGIDTGNLRVCGPGITDEFKTRDYFVRASIEVNGPRIPVINAANAAGTFATAIDKASTTGTNIQLFVAEMATPFAS